MIAVAQSNTEPWISIWENGQKVTWMSETHNRVKIINFQSKNTPFFVREYDRWFEKLRYNRFIGRFVSYFNYLNKFFISKSIPEYEYLESHNLLIADSWSTYQLIGRRNFALFHYFYYKTDFDFLLMSNTSSYFNQDQVMKLIDKLGNGDDVYAGVIISPNGPNSFVSGAGKLLSRSIVKKSLENISRYKHDNLEDVSFGDLMRSLNIRPSPLPRLDISDPCEVHKIPKSLLNDHFHFRCKSSEEPRRDVEIMLTLHSILCTK
jgi:hypothetical protein